MKARLLGWGFKPHPNNNPPKGGGFKPPIFVKPDRQLALEQVRLKQLQQRLRRAIAAKLEFTQQEQLRLRARCQALDPQLVLQRGYALVRQNSGEIVRGIDQLEIGTELSIQFGVGQAKVTVINISNGQKENVEL